MERSGLVVEHDVITQRHTDDEVTARRGQQDHQVFVEVLIRIRMVGVTAVTAHGDTAQFAHEVIFKTGADNLAVVIEIFRSDKTDNGVHHERIIVTRQAVVTGFHGHLVSTVVSAR